ncbi:MAG: restriction endonuclease subunit S [Candidatus Saccharimonadaceae bacterium]
MKTVSLNEVCEVITRGVSPKYTDDSAHGVTVLNQKCIRNNRVSLVFSRLHNISQKPVNQAKIVRVGDILVNSTGHGTLGRTGLVEQVDGTLLTDSHITIIRPKQGLFDFRYFAYLIGMCESDFISMATGTSGQTELPRALLYEYEIRYEESLDKQRQIVAKLNAAFEKIDQAAELNQANANNVNDLYISHLEDQFKGHKDWHTETLETNVKFIDYRGKTPKKTQSGMRLITAKNIKMGHLSNSPLEYVDPEIYENWMVRGIPLKGDVLFTTEAPLANVALLDTDERVVFAQRCIILQPNRKHINPEFLKYSLLSRSVRLSILDNATGATVSGIRSALLKKICISVPEMPTQTAIANRMNEIRSQANKLSTLYDIKRQKFRELKQSMLSEAFSESAVE